MTKTCLKCGGPLELGFTTAEGLVGGDRSHSREPQLVFIVPGVRTSANPIKAFQQGFSDDAVDRRYRIAGLRCSRCGALELYAEDERST